jgi:uncharacterized protein YdeI (YjbR/CyaY-like superfamily)
MNTLYAADTTAWRDWLDRHGTTERSVWLVIHHKDSGTPSVGYREAIKHALCFGWVDSKSVRNDDTSCRLRFTPRNPASSWAATNRGRAQKLIDAGLMRPAGQAMIDLAKRTGRWDVLGAVGNGGVPEDLRERLAVDPVARRHFEAFPPSAKRLILEWIVTARRPETRERRIARTVELAHDDIRANQPGGR